MSNPTNNTIAVSRTFTSVVGFCPKCGNEVTATGADVFEATANLGRTCGAAFCEAYVDVDYMVLGDDGWRDTRSADEVDAAAAAAVVELNPVDSAKEIVKILRKAFPGVKFSRRMSRGTGYGTLNLSWTDGPTATEVEDLVGSWQGKSFDGMTDSTNYHRREVKTVKGDVVVSGIGYLFTRREVSEGELERVLEGLLEAGYREHVAGDLRNAAAQITRGAAVFSACAHCNLYRVEV